MYNATIVIIIIIIISNIEFFRLVIPTNVVWFDDFSRRRISTERYQNYTSVRSNGKFWTYIHDEFNMILLILNCQRIFSELVAFNYAIPIINILRIIYYICLPSAFCIIPYHHYNGPGSFSISGVLLSLTRVMSCRTRLL